MACHLSQLVSSEGDSDVARLTNDYHLQSICRKVNTIRSRYFIISLTQRFTGRMWCQFARNSVHCWPTESGTTSLCHWNFSMIVQGYRHFVVDRVLSLSSSSVYLILPARDIIVQSASAVLRKLPIRSRVVKGQHQLGDIFGESSKLGHLDKPT